MTILSNPPQPPPERAVVLGPPRSSGPLPSRRRVLVVEDEFFIAEDIADALRELGAEVIGPVPRLAEALAMINGSGPIDFAVLDLNLEGGADFSAADALIAHGIPFIFVTGYDRSFLPLRFRHVPYWEKPVDLRALAQALRGLGNAGAATTEG